MTEVEKYPDLLPGYLLDKADPDTLILGGPMARWLPTSMPREAIEKAAWEDYKRREEREK